MYQSLARAPGERLDVVVIPVASGVPERSGPGTAADIHQHLYAPRVVVVDPRTESEEVVLGAIRRADVVWFTGGDQVRITRHMFGTRAHAELRELLRRGGTIAGTSAGAAMMGEMMITDGSSRAAFEHGMTREPDGPGVSVDVGMGFLHGVLTDQHFEARDRQGRLRVAMLGLGIPFGMGVNENRAVLVDLETGEWVGVGERACVVISLADDGVNEWSLNDGETFDPNSP